jgi:hypothetical protein
MNMNKNPAPRANAGSRANSKVQQHQIIASPVDWKADAAAGWLARHLAVPEALARVLVALASLGRAFQ